MNDDLDLAARYASWDTEDLARSATAEAAEFTPEALAAIRRELERRGYAPGHVPPTATAAPSAAVLAPRGVGGFLLLLIVVIAQDSLAGLLTPIGMAMTDTLRRPTSLLIAAGSACLGAYGIFCCVLLVRKDRRAPAHAALWLGAGVVGAILASVIFYLAPEPLAPFSMSHVSLVAVAVPTRIINCVIWLIYLARSKRVRATFGAW